MLLLTAPEDGRTVCPYHCLCKCKGARLNKEALHFRIHDKNINDLANMDINELYDWLMNVDQFLSDKQKENRSRDSERNSYAFEILVGCRIGLFGIEP